MRGIAYRILYKTENVVHPTNGYIFHSEFRRFGRQLLTNLCVWDGTTWHQAPLSEWNRATDGYIFEGWIRGHLPKDAWDEHPV